MEAFLVVVSHSCLRTRRPSRWLSSAAGLGLSAIYQLRLSTAHMYDPLYHLASSCVYISHWVFTIYLERVPNLFGYNPAWAVCCLVYDAALSLPYLTTEPIWLLRHWYAGWGMWLYWNTDVSRYHTRPS